LDGKRGAAAAVVQRNAVQRKIQGQH
jgi:hypothetical protein